MKNPHPIKYILPVLLTWLLWTPREYVEVQWSSKSWVHNVFRAWEMIFWRRAGIRAEASVIEKDDVVYHYFHTAEAAFAHIESKVRALLLRAKPSPFRIYIPMFITPTGVPIPASPYLFAIAFDAKTNAILNTNGVTSKDTTFTCTGSNLLLLTGIVLDNNLGTDPTQPTATYNSVSLSLQASVNTADHNGVGLNYLIAPATGANTHTVSRIVSTGTVEIMIASYTGVKQTGFPDGSTSGTNRASTSITVTAANCWCASIVRGTGTLASGTTLALRQAGPDADRGLMDSNGTVATGSVTISWAPTTPTTNMGDVDVSFAPPASANTANFLAFM